jgi:hypothetical protein
MKRPWVVITLASVAGALGGLLALIGGFVMIWNCGSGDGGVPYVSPNSPQADVCSATSDGLLVAAIGIVAAAGLAVAAVYAGRAWIAGARRVLLFVLLAIGAALAPMAILWVANAPSNTCVGEDKEAYDAWVDDGGHGSPPVDCAIY